MNPATALRRLERIYRDYGSDSGEKKARLRDVLALDLRSAGRVARLHEILCFLRAYPDDAPLLAEVERGLSGFGRRPDLRRHRGELADTGIVGTSIRYRFFWQMARWLASRWPDRLRFDREEGEEFESRLRAALPFVVSWIEAESVRRSEASTWDLIDRLRGKETDAAWFLRRIDSLPGGVTVREAFHDAVDAVYVLEGGRGGPARTRARLENEPTIFRGEPLDRRRPDLECELRRPPVEVHSPGRREGEKILDLAREAMVTRNRDLDAFTWGNARDVTWVDDGGGLAFALVGMVPERRLPLPSVHGWLTFQNGVPIGYVQSDTLLGAAEIAFNTFETYRGGEAGRVFGRVLAVARHVLGARAFSIEPYQLGRGNAEGIASGAWWFYFKLGFRPKDGAVKRVLSKELARVRRNADHRSTEATLERLASAHLFWEPERGVRSLLPGVPALGLRLAPVGGTVSARAKELLEIRSFHGWSADERRALDRLAPLVCALPGLTRWSSADRRRFAEVVRSKGAVREIEFSARFSDHRQGSRALARLL